MIIPVIPGPEGGYTPCITLGLSRKGHNGEKHASYRFELRIIVFHKVGVLVQQCFLWRVSLLF